MRELRAFLRMQYEYRKELRSLSGSPVKFHNLWPYDDYRNLWLYRFIRHRGILQNSDKEIAFFSVFGHRRKLQKNRSDVKVFFTGENVQRKVFSDYSDHCLGEVDLSMGFEYRDEKNYLRFPLWIMYVIEPEFSEKEIAQKLSQISEIGKKIPPSQKKFCSLVASHDENGIRTKMFNALSRIAPVDSGGNLLHNTEDLRKKYGNNKIEFLSHYKFNICPENSDIPGYVTEKAFEAIWAGCIPVYQGSGNDPEPEVLNRHALLLWDKADHGDSAIRLAEKLQGSDARYTEFISQPRFRPDAAQFVAQTMDELETRLRDALKK